MGKGYFRKFHVQFRMSKPKQRPPIDEREHPESGATQKPITLNDLATTLEDDDWFQS